MVVKAQNRFISNNAERAYNKHQVSELRSWLPQFLAIEQQRPVEEWPTNKMYPHSYFLYNTGNTLLLESNYTRYHNPLLTMNPRSHILPLSSMNHTFEGPHYDKYNQLVVLQPDILKKIW
jgi:hypothetical protein